MPQERPKMYSVPPANKTVNDDLISVFDAAQKLGIYKQTLFKVIKRLGVDTIKQKSSAHRGQAISYITIKDFDLIVENRSITDNHEKGTSPISSTQIDHGVFYLIQLEPEQDPGRFKLGFASNMHERLRSHRCSAPFADIVKTWPCHVLWEKTAIDCVTQGCEKLHTEVFRANDIEGVKNKCEQFFALMPALKDIMR